MCYKHLPEDINTVGFYFLRISEDPIPIPPNIEKAHSVLPAYFEMGTVDHKPLNALEKMLSHLFLPMLMLQGI